MNMQIIFLGVLPTIINDISSKEACSVAEIGETMKNVIFDLLIFYRYNY